ncbi:MAG: hypothetical protein OJI67_05940, partial [Prosthecobacter sp.]|nr:hypothetical protein [Prosthecobacter sp.]
LIANGVIENLPLQDLYEDGESLEIEPVPGVELIFWPETQRFEVIYISLSNSAETNQPVYEMELPSPFNGMTVQEEVHKILGEPIFSKGTLELMGTGLSGWDTYQLNPQWHPAAFVEFQYIKSAMQISRLQFSIIDRNV